jgi:hypothetical protein
VSFGVIFLVPGALAAHYFCPAGDVACLVDAVAAANDSDEADVIELEEGRYIFTEPLGEDSSTPEGVAIWIQGSPLIIEGNGATIERDANALPFGLIESIETVQLRNLTLRGGNARYWGGAITSWGDMSIEDCVIEENESNGAGAIYSDETMYILRSTIRRNVSKDVFGAIWSFNQSGSRMVIQDSVIDQNSGDASGAFSAEEVLEVINTTISRNTASPVYGRGIGYFWCSTTFTNSTLVDNSGGLVGGALIANGWCADAEDESGFHLVNSILSRNSGGTANDCISHPYQGGDLFSDGNNIFGDLSGCNASVDPSDQFVDPMLAPFMDNDTPGHGHYPPLNGSPAVDGGNNAQCWPLDQIGNPRYDGDGDGIIVCDIGAIEYQGEQYEVAIDFKPGNTRNVINPRSKGRFWLAILSDAEIDALQVDPESVALGEGGASPDRYRVKDVNRDRMPDLMLRFRTPEVGFQCGDREVELIGETYAGDSIIGSDSVKTVGCKKLKNGNKKSKKVKKK